MGSVLAVVAGCIVAGIGDLTFDPYGYLFALGSCTCQAAYLLLVEFQVCASCGVEGPCACGVEGPRACVACIGNQALCGAV